MKRINKMKRIIFLAILLVLIPLISSLTTQEVCLQVYSFIINTNGSYNFLQINDLNQRLGINNSEEYILDFNNKCLSYFNGVLDQAFLTAYSKYNQTCQVNIPSFFESSLKINTSIYLGDFSCKTHKWLDYFIEMDNQYLKGIRFWLIIPMIIMFLLFQTILEITKEKRKKRRR